MEVRSPELAPELVGFPLGGRLPETLIPVVNDLHARRAEVVTTDDLARYSTGLTPSATARSLRRSGWLEPLRTKNAWAARFVMSPPHLGDFVELRARLRTHPNTPAAIAGKSVASVRNWLRRAAAATIGCPSKYQLPQCLDGLRVCRFQPQLPLDQISGLPVWKSETLIVFMVARPSQFDWVDIGDWLWEACIDADPALLIRELAGRRRSVWMKTAYLASRGDRVDAAKVLLHEAPRNGTGPYVFGHAESRAARTGIAAPQWSQEFQVLDYVLPTHWIPRW